MNILVMLGPGTKTLEKDANAAISSGTLEVTLRREAMALGVGLHVVQSNHEGALVDGIEEWRSACDGALVFPGGLAMGGWCLREAIRVLGVKAVEVHFSPELAKGSILKPVCVAQKMGVTGALQGLRLLAGVETRTDGAEGRTSKGKTIGAKVSAGAQTATHPGKSMGRKGAPMEVATSTAARKSVGKASSPAPRDSGKTLGRRK